MPCREVSPRAGCGKSASPVRRAAAGNGARVETEAPAEWRKPSATATPSPYSNRARRRLHPGWGDGLRRQPHPVDPEAEGSQVRTGTDEDTHQAVRIDASEVGEREGVALPL